MSGDVVMLARAVASAVFQSVSNAVVDPERESYWLCHADKLEQKFTSQHGRHYSYFMEPADERG